MKNKKGFHKNIFKGEFIMKNEIILFENQDIKLEVNMKDETVWLTQTEIAQLFGKAVSTINEHIKNIYKEKELDEVDTITKFGNSEFSDKPTNFYNLDVIISVGYRVKSKNGIIFRKWANSILKDYMLKGYAINQKRLEYLEKTVKLIDIATRNQDTTNDNVKEVLNVINDFSKGLDLLDNYDHRSFKKLKGRTSTKMITYKNCTDLIELLKFNETSDIFALERDKGLGSIINNIYQSFDGNDVYPTLEEKAANFLYLIVKNHVFIDGNKRIAATLFIYFLHFYNILTIEDKNIIDNNTLAALTILIAESNPKEKNIMIDLIMNILNNY